MAQPIHAKVLTWKSQVELGPAARTENVHHPWALPTAGSWCYAIVATKEFREVLAGVRGGQGVWPHHRRGRMVNGLHQTTLHNKKKQSQPVFECLIKLRFKTNVYGLRKLIPELVRSQCIFDMTHGLDKPINPLNPFCNATRSVVHQWPNHFGRFGIEISICDGPKLSQRDATARLAW
jgi:hypothetical protein